MPSGGQDSRGSRHRKATLAEVGRNGDLCSVASALLFVPGFLLSLTLASDNPSSARP